LIILNRDGLGIGVYDIRGTGRWQGLCFGLRALSLAFSKGELLEEVGEDGHFPGWIVRNVGSEVLEDGGQGHLLEQFEVTLVYLELYNIEERGLHVFYVESFLLRYEHKTLFFLFLAFDGGSNHGKDLKSIQESGQYLMFHLDHLDLDCSHNQCFGNGFILVLFYFFNEFNCPLLVDVPIYFWNEEGVGMADEVVEGLRCEYQEGVVGVEDGLAVGDDEGRRICNQYLLLFHHILVEDDAQEQLVGVLEFLHLVVQLRLVERVLLPQFSDRMGDEQDLVEELGGAVEGSDQRPKFAYFCEDECEL
jgi:hypothetical protein